MIEKGIHKLAIAKFHQTKSSDHLVRRCRDRESDEEVVVLLILLCRICSKLTSLDHLRSIWIYFDLLDKHLSISIRNYLLVNIRTGISICCLSLFLQCHIIHFFDGILSNLKRTETRAFVPPKLQRMIPLTSLLSGWHDRWLVLELPFKTSMWWLREDEQFAWPTGMVIFDQ